LRLLNNIGIPATVFANALSAETYPDLIREIVRCERAIAGHGYAQNEYRLDMSDSDQDATIRTSLDIWRKPQATDRPDG